MLRVLIGLGPLEEDIWFWESLVLRLILFSVVLGIIDRAEGKQFSPGDCCLPEEGLFRSSSGNFRYSSKGDFGNFITQISPKSL